MSANAQVWFDLSAGTVGTAVGGAVGLIEKYADGWYRCMIMGDSASGGTTPFVAVFLGSGSETSSYNGDSVSGVYVWGMQFEVDVAFPSSYLSTGASTTARVADALTYTLAWLGDAILASKDDLTMYARLARPFHADAVGSFVTDTSLFGLSTSTARLVAELIAASRNISSTIVDGVGNPNQTLAIPSGDVLEASVQYKNLRTGGQSAVDAGSGLTAFGTAAAGFAAYGDTTIDVGAANGLNQLFGALFEVKIARGLRTFKQMQETI